MDNNQLSFNFEDRESLESRVNLPPRKKLRKTKFNYEDFREEVDFRELEPNNIFRYTPEKRDKLIDYGVPKLTIRPGESMPMDMAKPERVGRAVQDKYNIAVRRANQ